MSQNTLRFRLLDLLILILLVLVLFAFTLIGTSRVHEYSGRSQCAANLRQIGQGMMQYALDNGGHFPRTRFDPNLHAWNEFTRPNAVDPFGSDGPLPNDVTASLYLLIRGNYAPPQSFRCPATVQGGSMLPSDATANRLSNFASPALLGYSVANPYSDAVAEKNGYDWDSKVNPDFALVADLNPGAEALSIGTLSNARAMSRGNSKNEWDRRGESVLFGDFHAEFVQNPFCGVARDNIYTFGPASAIAGGTGVVGSPLSGDDSVLLPVTSGAVQPEEPPDEYARRWNFYLITARCALIAAIFIAIFTRIGMRLRRRSRQSGFPVV